MERAVAVKKLGRLLGKSLGYRVNNDAPTAEERNAAKAALAAAVEERNQIQKKKDKRYSEILSADNEYQALRAAYKEASKRVDKLGYTARTHKFIVGTTTDLFFVVKAEGDSWEEVILKVSEAA